jgi:hypothetical protein
VAYLMQAKCEVMLIDSNNILISWGNVADATYVLGCVSPIVSSKSIVSESPKRTQLTGCEVARGTLTEEGQKAGNDALVILPMLTLPRRVHHLLIYYTTHAVNSSRMMNVRIFVAFSTRVPDRTIL